MEQHVCRDLDRSAYNEVLTVFSHLLEMEKELEDINLRLQVHPDDALIERQMILNDQFAAQGGLTCRARARSTLMGLGFPTNRWECPLVCSAADRKQNCSLPKCSSAAQTCCCWTNPPTIWTSSRWNGWKTF